jgi:hypothetical protein
MSFTLMGAKSGAIYPEEFASHLAGISTVPKTARLDYIRNVYTDQRTRFSATINQSLNALDQQKQNQLLKYLENKKQRVELQLEFRKTRSKDRLIAQRITRHIDGSLGKKIKQERDLAQSIFKKGGKTIFGASPESRRIQNANVEARLNSKGLYSNTKSAGELLRSKPTTGLIGVLEKAARGAKKFMSRIPIR